MKTGFNSPTYHGHFDKKINKMMSRLNEHSSLWIGLCMDETYKEQREFMRIQIDHKVQKDGTEKHKCFILWKSRPDQQPSEGYAVTAAPSHALHVALISLRADQIRKGYDVPIPLFDISPSYNGPNAFIEEILTWIGNENSDGQVMSYKGTPVVIDVL